MTKDIDFSYLNNEGKRVTGSAAAMHYIYTEKGGVRAYNDEVGSMYVREFIEEHSEAINEAIQAKIRRDRFKVV